ncbi:hypothetical protein H5410_037559 [Solanum commersonii]|uniref:Uncharacterized protein n=1 Tax=Solanum commersonii TaxID=4109 RepID=A0A9J5Y8T1_SOLCO|nr:hypothetical protein H5410_037559 [Solanum commersonii]
MYTYISDNIKSPLVIGSPLEIVRLVKDYECHDCGMFVAAFAEFLSDEINMSYDSFRSDYLRKKICNVVMEVWSRQGQCWIC